MRFLLRLLFGEDGSPWPWLATLLLGGFIFLALVCRDILHTLPWLVLSAAVGNSLFVLSAAVAFSIVVAALTGAGVIRHRLSRRGEDIYIEPPRRPQLPKVARKLLKKG